MFAMQWANLWKYTDIFWALQRSNLCIVQTTYDTTNKGASWKRNTYLGMRVFFLIVKGIFEEFFNDSYLAVYPKHMLNKLTYNFPENFSLWWNFYYIQMNPM